MPSARPFSSEYSLFFNSHYYLSISLCVSHTLFLSLSLIPSTLPLFFLFLSLIHVSCSLSLFSFTLIPFLTLTLSTLPLFSLFLSLIHVSCSLSLFSFTLIPFLTLSPLSLSLSLSQA